MQHSPDEIKDRLLKALDKDNNVVDMVAVLDIITYLEDHTITKEALEQTRLGKYINELRKKTQNEDLAKRAKKLVRGWQKLITAPSPNEGPVNGERIAAQKSHTPSHLEGLKKNESMRGNISPVLATSRPNTPQSRLVTSPNNMVSRPSTPLSITSSRSQTPISRYIQNNAKHKPASPALSAVKSNITTVRSPSPLSPALKPSNSDSSRDSLPQCLDKTNAANKKRRREEQNDCAAKKTKSPVSNSDNKIGNNSKDFTPDWILEREIVMNGSVESKERLKLDCNLAKAASVGKCVVPSPLTVSTPNRAVLGSKSDSEKSLQLKDKVTRTPKVKTTAQLIAELQAKTGGSNMSSDTINKIATNQIQKEPDLDQVSIVPAGAKPRPRKKPGFNMVPPTASESALIQTKTEMVHKFLQSSLTPRQGSTDPELQNTVMGKFAAFRTESPTNSDLVSQSDSSVPVDVCDQSPSDNSKAGDSRIVNSREKCNEEEHRYKNVVDPYSLLPPLNIDNIVWEEDEYEVPEKMEVSDETVKKMSDDHIPGVNGCYDSDGVWHGWEETYTNRTAGDYVLPLLPYVDIGF